MPVGLPQCGMMQQEHDSQVKEDGDDSQLHNHDRGVQIRRLLDAYDQDRGDCQDAEKRDYVENARVACGRVLASMFMGRDVRGVHFSLYSTSTLP